jgi:hypothetical protein
MTYAPEHLAVKDAFIWLAQAAPWLAVTGYGGKLWKDALRAKHNPVRDPEAQGAAKQQYDKALRFLVGGAAALLGYYNVVLPWILRLASGQG